MSAAKSERLLNLVILLLVARNYTSKEQIRQLMEPYRASTDEAFDRMFERDKDDLRALGIPLETGFVDKFFEDEHGYRIKRDAFELPAIDFAADEVAVWVWPPASGATPGSRPPPPTPSSSSRPPGSASTGSSSSRCSRPWSPRSRPSSRCGRPRCTAPPCSSTTAGPASATPPPVTWSRGVSSRPRGGGTSRAWTPTVASPGCSGSAGLSPQWSRRGTGVVHRAGGHRPARPLRVARAACAGLERRGPGQERCCQRAAAPGRGQRHRCHRPGRHPRLGPAGGALRVGDRLRRRAAGVRRRGGRGVTQELRAAVRERLAGVLAGDAR